MTKELRSLNREPDIYLFHTDTMVQTQPQCRNCKNYYITYDPAKPHGCRALGFKSQRLPSLVVFETSGIACQLFVPKQAPGGNAGSSGSWVA